MKKLLIASAALAMVAGTAQAQSSVTVYGVIDTGYNSVKGTFANGDNTTAKGVLAGQSGGNGEAASSRLGFRGTEDLGGGKKANFVVETGIGSTANAAGAATVIGDRAFWAGLEDSKMGQLRIGRQDTFTRSNWLAHDQLAFANVVGNLAHSNAGVPNGTSTTDPVAGVASGSHTARNIAVNYLSPRFNGVQLSLGMTQDDVQSSTVRTTKAGSGSQVGLNYTAGKVSAGVAYVEATTATNQTAATGAFLNTDSNPTANATSLGVPQGTLGNSKTKDTSAAASYDLGVARVAYIYNKRDGVNTDAANGIANVDRTSHSFSASVPMGAKLVGRVGYGFGELRQGQASNYNGDIKGMQAALNYNLSKRTMAYVIYGDESREISATTKAKVKEYSVGVRHNF